MIGLCLNMKFALYFLRKINQLIIKIVKIAKIHFSQIDKFSFLKNGDNYMKGIVNWYDDVKKHGLIEGKDGKDIMICEKDIPFLTILHAGDVVEYSIVKTDDGCKVKNVKQINKRN